MTSALAVFGSLTVDDLVFPDGTTRWAVPGGGAAYAALAAALWTDRVSIVAPLGTDYPAVLPDRIDLSRCRRIPHALRNWGLYEDDGSRHFISRNNSRNWIDFCPTIEDVASGEQTAAHLAPMPPARALALSEELRRHGTRLLSLDLDDHDLLYEEDPQRTHALIRSVELFLPSLPDMERLCSCVDPLDGLRRLRQIAPQPALLAVKCGSRGVYAHAAGASEWIHTPALPVTVRDATGAGDAFCGGALAALEQTGDPVEALLRGTVSAAFCIEHEGFTGLLHAKPEKAEERLRHLRTAIRSGDL